MNNFLKKLLDNWINNLVPNDCNKEIIKLQKENIYFNLLDKRYTPSMKKAIFIFLALKPILDKI